MSLMLDNDKAHLTQTSKLDTTIEELKIFVKRLMKREQDFCPECRKILKESLN